MKYEYLIIRNTENREQLSDEKLLDRAGLEGWDLVSVYGSGDYREFYMRRPRAGGRTLDSMRQTR